VAATTTVATTTTTVPKYTLTVTPETTIRKQQPEQSPSLLEEALQKHAPVSLQIVRIHSKLELQCQSRSQSLRPMPSSSLGLTEAWVQSTVNRLALLIQMAQPHLVR
jgi:hypothetical protein